MHLQVDLAPLVTPPHLPGWWQEEGTEHSLWTCWGPQELAMLGTGTEVAQEQQSPGDLVGWRQLMHGAVQRTL